jgi:hypothetical protein
MGSRRMRLAFATAALAGLVATSSASAEPTAADRETARSLMQEGRELRDKGDLQGALKRFQAADGIMHVPTTGLEVARTQATLGLLVEARDTIAAIRKTPPKPNEPEPFAEARNKADELDSSLDGRIPSLTIAVDGAGAGETVTISIDGVQVPAAALGLPRKVDPGHHVVTGKTATAEGSQEIDVREKEQKQVQLTLAPGSTTPPMGANDTSGTSQEPLPEGEQTTSHSPGWLTWAGAGVGVVGIGVGSVTGLMELSKTSSLGSGNPPECPNKMCVTAQAKSDRDSALTLSTISTVSFIVGGIGAAVAVGSLIIGHPIPSASTAPVPSAARLDVTPWVGLGAAGLRGSF